MMTDGRCGRKILPGLFLFFGGKGKGGRGDSQGYVTHVDGPHMLWPCHAMPCPCLLGFFFVQGEKGGVAWDENYPFDLPGGQFLVVSGR